MGIVANTNCVERAVGRRQPEDIAFIRRFDFENYDGLSFDLMLLALLQPRPPLSTGWPNPRGPFWEVVIAFEKVANLNLCISGPWDLQTEGFQIEDVSHYQWESIRLRVYDYERETYRFDARSATIRSCVPARNGPDCPGLSRVYPGSFPGQKGGAEPGAAADRGKPLIVCQGVKSQQLPRPLGLGVGPQ